MAGLLLAFVFAISAACVVSYQQNVLWGGGLSGSGLSGFGSGQPVGYGNSGYESGYGFTGGLGGLSVYGSGDGGNGGNLEFSPFPHTHHRGCRHFQDGYGGGIGSSFGNGLLGHQNLQLQQQPFGW
ncbi:uncharacterized protein LOC142590923 [Dermacentor variabilis]|uniref:uncharacterized protein LOC142590923 n=1 Tax=Dermacentor variabilis TaxID=34621 RepID=UPI003F5B0ADB